MTSTPVQPTVTHPKWCDRSKCNAERIPGLSGVHLSRRIVIEQDPATEVGVEVMLWRSNGGTDQIIFEFPGGTGEGNDLTTNQTLGLIGALINLVGEANGTLQGHWNTAS
jgi:hypothetical protein